MMTVMSLHIDPSLPNKKTAGKVSNAELCFLIAMASWAMLFGALILIYILARVKTPVWPPAYIASFPLLLPTFSTLSLGVSSLLVTKALKQREAGATADFKFYLLLGILCGILFGVLQYVALSSWMTFDPRKHVYSSLVAFLIVFHGVHYLVGLSGLVFNYFKQYSFQSLRLWSWFWHFLGVVWLAIFMALAI
jgi:heme/copper-type cytochrome/quinol oxidase subunit 3